MDDIRIRAGIEAFTLAMYRELQENTHKGDFLLWSPSPDRLREEIIDHADKLRDSMYGASNPEKVTEKAADIANYGLKAFLLYPSPRYWDAVRGVPIRH